jgi:hypothetical protein
VSAANINKPPHSVFVFTRIVERGLVEAWPTIPKVIKVAGARVIEQSKSLDGYQLASEYAETIILGDRPR